MAIVGIFLVFNNIEAYVQELNIVDNLYNYYSNYGNTVIAGDFNGSILDRRNTNTRKSDLLRSFVSQHNLSIQNNDFSVEGDTYTFIQKQTTLDYILFDKYLIYGLQSYKIIEEGSISITSDHLPIVAKFDFKISRYSLKNSSSKHPAWHKATPESLAQYRHRTNNTLRSIATKYDLQNECELDEYIRVLNGIEGDLDNPITEVEVGAWIDDATAAARRIEVRMLSLMLDIGTDIDDRQIANFTNKLLESQEKYRKEYLQRDDEEYRQENFKSLSKNLRRFMGKLETTQKKALRETMQDMQRFDAIWLEDRQRWLDALAFHLQRKPGWQNEILLAHQRREDTRSEEYRETYAHNTGVLKKAISNIINSRSEAQDERMRKEINALKEDFEALSSEKTPVSWYEEPAVRYRL